MYQGERTLSDSLYESLSFLKDPRDNRGKKHDLREIIILLIIGYLIGKKDFVNIEHALKLRLPELKKFLELKNGIPSHDTMSRVMRILDDWKLMDSLENWLWQLVEHKGNHFAIDGKGQVAAANKNKSEKTPYILNVLDTVSKIAIMQMKVGEKTNEIPEISHILEYLDLRNAVVTIDAIGTQKKVMNEIISKGGHFVLPVKENQRIFYNDLVDYFSSPLNQEEIMKYEEEISNNHGRIEKRIYYVSNKTECISNTEFSMIKTVGIVKRERQKVVYNDQDELVEDNKTLEVVPYVSDMILEPKKLASYIRGHWTIENSLHWVLDHSFNEDRATNKKENSVQNTALIRKIAYNIVRLYQTTVSEESFEYVFDEFANNVGMIMNFVLSTEL